jgi:hypothetical protein
MSFRTKFVLALGFLIGMGGCKTTKTPDLFNPGTAEYQQRQAVRFDPYPDPNIGPEIVGGRPRDYQQPIPETDRARWTVPSSGASPQ